MIAAIRTYPHYKFITPQKIVELTPTFVGWGFAAATGLALFGLDIPIVRDDVLSKLPVVGKIFSILPEPKEEVFHRAV
ncbi:hypothetical protein BDF21DRAFT_416459 [Thamnidium elegans]|nr:hypothetical protein BDF21DRAFT_416459 [Thamnidium elegans]